MKSGLFGLLLSACALTVSVLVACDSAALARGGGGHGGGRSAFRFSSGGPYSGIHMGSSSYASPQSNSTTVPRNMISNRRWGGGGGRRRYYNNMGYNNMGYNNMGSGYVPPPAQYQSQVFSGPAYISPANYHYFVQNYSWPSNQSGASAYGGSRGTAPQQPRGLSAQTNSL